MNWETIKRWERDESLPAAGSGLIMPCDLATFINHQVKKEIKAARCGKCRGTGFLSDFSPCPECNGTGQRPRATL